MSHAHEEGELSKSGDGSLIGRIVHRCCKEVANGKGK